MPLACPLQPDQDPVRWDAHVSSYEAVFEPLTDAFARRALDLLEPLRDAGLLDLAAGAGGAALQAAERRARVTAVDASPAMVARIRERAAQRGVRPGNLSAQVQAGGAALAFGDGAFDAALSSFGVVLFPDPAHGMAELRRVLRPGGRVAVVTWTEPHRYELATRLSDAIAAVRGALPLRGDLPAQLRFTDPARLRALVAGAGFGAVRIERVEAALTAPSARALAASLAFAPGMEAALAAPGLDRNAVTHAFAARLEADQGLGATSLAAVAHVAIAARA